MLLCHVTAFDVGAMLRCRSSSVSAASLLRVNFTVHATRALRHHGAVCCSPVNRRLPDGKAAVSHRSGFITLTGCERGGACTSLLDAPYALNATQQREYGDWTHGDHRRVCGVNELGWFSSVRQTRGASTTPEKAQERAGGVEAVSTT